MSIIGERDYGSQEICHLLNNQPLSRCSREFVFLRPLSEEWVAITNDQSSVTAQKSLMDKYCARPPEMKHMCLFDFAKSMNAVYVKNRDDQIVLKFRRRTKEAVVRIFPNPKLTGDNDKDELFYKNQVILRAPFRGNVDDLLEDKLTNIIYPSWQARFISLDIQLEPHLELPIIDERYAKRKNNSRMYPILNPISAKQKDSNATELGERMFDVAHDWEKASQDYPESAKAREFLANFRQNSVSEHTLGVTVCSNDMALSDEQNAIYQIFVEQLAYVQHSRTGTNGTSNRNVPPRRIMVQGRASSRKSTLIGQIVNKVCETLGSEFIKIAAPMGSSAENIGGTTIHSLFKLGFSNKYQELTGESKATFLAQMKHVRWIIIMMR